MPGLLILLIVGLIYFTEPERAEWDNGEDCEYIIPDGYEQCGIEGMYLRSAH